MQGQTWLRRVYNNFIDFGKCATTGAVKTWNPAGGAAGCRDLIVSTLAVAGGVVYAGGYFTQMGGATRNHIATIDAPSGVVTTWYPTNGANDIVRTLTVTGGVVYAGGWFTLFGNLPFYKFAAIDASTGEPK